MEGRLSGVFMEIKHDCAHFKGDIPCKQNKEKGKMCKCDEYEKRGKRILIIKLDAMGDVLRTTPIVRKLRNEFKNCEITWVTRSPEFASADHILEYNNENVIRLIADSFDIAYNFDKSTSACALMNLVKAENKKGFFMRNGKCYPIDNDAMGKFITGLFDQAGEENTKSYVQEIFDIAGMRFSREKYILNIKKEKFGIKKKRRLIGLNTGAGSGWPGRLWPEKNWGKLANILKKKGFDVVFLGGRKEHEMNLRLKKKTGCNYYGYFGIERFVSLVDECDMIITCVTLALHIAIALEKKIVLLNSVFNKNEFDLYDLGEILEPEVKGTYYSQSAEQGNMDTLKPEKVFGSAIEIMKR